MKKILYFHQYFNLPTMSGSIRSYELASKMAEKYHVIVISSDRTRGGNRIRSEFINPRLKIIWIPNKYSNHMNFLSRVMSFITFVLKAIKFSITERADIVVCTSTPLTIAVPGLIHKFRFHSKFIFEVRDSWPKVPIGLGLLKNPIIIFLANFLERFTYKHADHIIALSPGMADDVRGVFGHAKISMVPNFCNEVKIEDVTPYQFPEKIESGGKVILYAGTFGYVNNLPFIVDLADRCRGLDCVFVLVGDGKYKDTIKALAAEREVLDHNLFILDPVDKNEIYRMIKRSDFMISTVVDSQVMWANSANKFFDSIVFSKPVIINHQGWLADLVSKHRVGLVLDPVVSSDSVVDMSVLLDTADIGMIGRLSALASGEFSFNSVYSNYERILEEEL